VWTYNGTSWAPGTVAAASIAPGSSTQVLTTTGGVAVWAAPAAGGITQLTADVTAGPGSGSVAATVVAAQSGLLAFASGTGLITWATGATGPGLSQATAGNGVTPVNTTITPQAPNAGSATTASGTPGSVVVALAAPVSTGVEASFAVKRSGATQCLVGAWDLNPARAALYLGPSVTYGGSSILNTTASLIATSTDLSFCSQGTFNWYAEGAHISMFNGGNGEVTFGYNVALGQVGGGSYGGGAGGVLSIPKAGTNPSSSISTGGVIYADSSTGAICLYPAGVTGWQFQAANGTCYSAAVLQVGTTLAVNGAPTGPGGGGVGVIAMNNATTQPTAASVSGGVALSANAGGLAIFAPSGTVATCIIGNNPTSSGGQGVIALNAAHTNPSASLTGQGVVYVDSSTGGICLYPASVTAPMLNISTNSAAFGAPLSGLNATPLQFNFTSIAIGVGGTTTVTAAAALTPKLILSGGMLTSGAIVDFTTNAGSFAGAVYFVDCAAINGGAALTTFGISFKNGTTTQSLTALPTGGLVIVTISGTNKITIN
jgi:hypothetical protein